MTSANSFGPNNACIIQQNYKWLVPLQHVSECFDFFRLTGAGLSWQGCHLSGVRKPESLDDPLFAGRARFWKTTHPGAVAGLIPSGEVYNYVFFLLPQFVHVNFPKCLIVCGCVPRPIVCFWLWCSSARPRWPSLTIRWTPVLRNWGTGKWSSNSWAGGWRLWWSLLTLSQDSWHLLPSFDDFAELLVSGVSGFVYFWLCFLDVWWFGGCFRCVLWPGFAGFHFVGVLWTLSMSHVPTPQNLGQHWFQTFMHDAIHLYVEVLSIKSHGSGQCISKGCWLDIWSSTDYGCCSYSLMTGFWMFLA